MMHAQTKQKVITDKDIRNAKVIVERKSHIRSITHPKAAVKQKSEPVPKSDENKLSIETAFNDGLISKDVFEMTKNKFETTHRDKPGSATKKTSKPEVKQTTVQADLLKTVKDSFDDGLVSEDVYEQAKAKFECDAKSAADALRKERTSDHARNRLEMVETDLYDMDKALKEAAKTSGEIKELRGKEEKYTCDLKALDDIYKDGIITPQCHEEKKKLLAKNIFDLEDMLLRCLEKEELDELKNRLEAEIRKDLTTGPFSIEYKRYKEDIVALTKIHEAGLISKEEYTKKKRGLNEKLNKADLIVSNIDAIFEEYKKELIEKIKEKELMVEKRLKSKDGLSAAYITKYQPRGLISKIKNVFRNSKKDDDVLDPAVCEIRKLKETSDKRDALVKSAFILKGLIEKNLEVKYEHTYNELIEKLPETGFDPAAQQSMIKFFEKVSDAEYRDYVNENELPLLLDDAERLAKLVSGMNKKEENSDKEPEKKTAVLEKVNNFFGV